MRAKRGLSIRKTRCMCGQLNMVLSKVKWGMMGRNMDRTRSR